MRLLYTLVFLLLTSVVFGQKSTLFQNVNVRAKELKHNLNTEGDSLIFNCERTIYEVVIFNDDFERVIKVRDSEAIIPIADIPVGRYIVEALLSDKLIVITLLRNEPFDDFEEAPLITDSTDLFGTRKAVVSSAEEPKAAPKVEAPINVEEEKVAEVTKEEPLPAKETFGEESDIKKTDLALAGKKRTPTKKAATLVKKDANSKKKKTVTSSLSLFNTKAKTAKKPKAQPTIDREAARANRIVSTYWVIYKINDGQSSQKIQQMSDQEAVDRLIRKNEIDMKTKSGRLNELIVWTVYDPPKFVEHKRKHKTDYLKIESESFKMEPYYKKVNNPDNL